jgi:hypothetical protein
MGKGRQDYANLKMIADEEGWKQRRGSSVMPDKAGPRAIYPFWKQLPR